MADFIAPNGGEIQGTSEVILAAAEVSFGDTPGEYDHQGGSEVFWDTSTTETIEGVPMFTDEDGSDWLAHHLIPQGTEPMDTADLDVLREEDRIGYSLRAARQLAGTADVLTAADRTQVNMIAADLERRYRKAKARSLALIQAHVAAHPVTEEEDA